MAKQGYTFRYRVRNWSEYNRALINRGRLTLWFDEHAVSVWRNTKPGGGPGAPRTYSDTAIQCAVMLKAVFHLSLRGTQGLLNSLMQLLTLELPVPDYSTVSRRQGPLSSVVFLGASSSPRHLVVGATGLKIYGASGTGRDIDRLGVAAGESSTSGSMKAPRKSWRSR